MAGVRFVAVRLVARCALNNAFPGVPPRTRDAVTMRFAEQEERVDFSQFDFLITAEPSKHLEMFEVRKLSLGVLDGSW